MGFGVSELTITFIFLAEGSFELSFTSGMHLDCQTVLNVEGAAALDELQLCLSGVGFRFGEKVGSPELERVENLLIHQAKPAVAFKDF